MVLINDVKYACQRCIRGHRVSRCSHLDKNLIMVKRKGRPAVQKLSGNKVEPPSKSPTCTCGALEPELHIKGCKLKLGSFVPKPMLLAEEIEKLKMDSSVRIVLPYDTAPSSINKYSDRVGSSSIHDGHHMASSNNYNSTPCLLALYEHYKGKPIVRENIPHRYPPQEVCTSYPLIPNIYGRLYETVPLPPPTRVQFLADDQIKLDKMYPMEKYDYSNQKRNIVQPVVPNGIATTTSELVSGLSELALAVPPPPMRYDAQARAEGVAADSLIDIYASIPTIPRLSNLY